MSLIIAGIFVSKSIRKNNVVEDLSGKQFSYYSSNSYDGLSFDENGVLTKSYVYSLLEVSDEYTCGYEVVFKDGKTYLEISSRLYEVRYNSYGVITGIYDTTYMQLYQ